MKNNNELSVSLSKLLRAYLRSRESEQLRVATIENYKFILTSFMRYMMANQIEHIADVTSQDIREYKMSLQDDGKASSTIDAHHRALATFFKWLYVEELIEKDPMTKVKKTKFDLHQKAIFTQLDIKELWLNCDNEMEEAMLYLFLDCALRLSEAVNLRLKHVDLELGLILLVNTKGRMDRTVPISEKTCKAIRRMIKKRKYDPESYLFVNRWGKQYTCSGFSQVFEKLKERAWVTTPGRLHGLRRTSLSTLAKNGVDLATVQKISGHRDIKTLVERYLVTDNQNMIDAVNAKGAVNSLLP